MYTTEHNFGVNSVETGMARLTKGCIEMKNKFTNKAAALLSIAMLWNLPMGACASLSIEEAVDMALKQNPDVRITELTRDSAAAALKKSRGANSVSVTATASGSLNHNGATGHGTGNSNSIRASLPIFNNKNKANIESDELGVNIADLTTYRKYEDIRLQVIKDYYDVLEAQKKVNVAKETVDKYQAHLTNVEQLYSAGSKAKVDVLRSSVELSNARQSLIKEENSHQLKLSTLRNVLNMSPTEELTLTDDFKFSTFGRELSDCVDYAMKSRKDLLVDEYKVKQKELALKAAKAGYDPTVSLSAGVSWDKAFYPRSNNHDYSAGISANWNIWDSGVTAAAVDSAKVDLETAKYTLDKEKNAVDLEVRQAYLNMREAEKRFVSTSDAVNQAQEDYFIASEKYKAGEGVMLDVIDAQNALSEAQLNYISAQYDYARYKATVENTMGLEATETTTGVQSAESESKTVMNEAANGVVK